MSKKGKSYSREFKIEAVKLSYNSDQSVADVAADLGISKSSLFRWRQEFSTDPDQAFPGKGQLKERDAEIVQLREVEMENEILKKAKRWAPSSSSFARRKQ